MKVAYLQGNNQGFFPRYYEALREAVIQIGGDAALFSPNSGINNRNKLNGQVIWGTRLNWHLHHILYKLTGREDCFSFFSTIDLVRKLKAFRPDVLHLNVINQQQIHLPTLVRYINENKIKVVWTFHDCRAFTGGCTYFDEVDCAKWMTGCDHCPQLKALQNPLFDKTRLNWSYKKKWLCSISNLIIVTPSKWMANFVGKSFFRKYPTIVVYNGVDTLSFSKLTNINIRSLYNISKKHIILGCAVNWEQRKGLCYMEQLVQLLPQDCQLVLIGNIHGDVALKLQRFGVILPGRTKTYEELVAWYQDASVFVNPTISDNFPTVNIESLAAGTPVITFNTGGSSESLSDETGDVVDQKDVYGLAKAIERILRKNVKHELKDLCQSRARSFSLSVFTEQYMNIYNNV